MSVTRHEQSTHQPAEPAVPRVAALADAARGGRRTRAGANRRVSAHLAQCAACSADARHAKRKLLALVAAHRMRAGCGDAGELPRGPGDALDREEEGGWLRRTLRVPVLRRSGLRRAPPGARLCFCCRLFRRSSWPPPASPSGVNVPSANTPTATCEYCIRCFRCFDSFDADAGGRRRQFAGARAASIFTPPMLPESTCSLRMTQAIYRAYNCSCDRSSPSRLKARWMTTK